jgi:hypothetical protein
MDQKKFVVVARGGRHRYTLVVAKRIFRLKLVFGMVPLDESDRNNALRRALALLTPRAVRLLSSLKGEFYSRLSDSLSSPQQRATMTRNICKKKKKIQINDPSFSRAPLPQK